MQVATLNGNAHHIAVRGPANGAAVLLINSLGTDLRLWEPLLPHLPEGWRLIRYDMRGHGLSACPAAPYSMDELAADAAALLDHLGVRGALVVGISIGGMVAQALAAARPDLTRAVVISNSAARIGTAEVWQDRIRTVRQGGVGALADGVLERWFTPAFRSGAEIALWRHMLSRQPAEGYAGCAAALETADLTERTRGLALPALAIAGDHDGSTPPDLVRATADLIAGARLELIAGGGHLPHVEQPELYARALTAFAREIGHG